MKFWVATYTDAELTRTGLPLFDSMLPILGPEDEIPLKQFEHIVGAGKLIVEQGVTLVLHYKPEDPARPRVRKLFVNGVCIRGNSCDLERIEVSCDTVTFVYDNTVRRFPWGTDGEVTE